QDAILGWLEDRAKGDFLLPSDMAERAEARRLASWFSRRFTDEVDAVLLHERMEKPLLRMGPPDARMLREGREFLKGHLTVLATLAPSREWLAGRRLSQADWIAAGQLSVPDCFGEIAWASWPSLNLWHSQLKSRPCSAPVLAVRFLGLRPAMWYAGL